MRLKSTIVVLLILGGCVEKTRELTPAEREQIRPYVGTEATRPEHPIEPAISFEDKIQLIGYDLEPDQVVAGQPFTITWHWRCDRALEEGWRLFTHVADATGGDRQNADESGLLRRVSGGQPLYGPERWRAGEYIKDPQELTLPADWGSPRATFYIGIWHGPHRLQVTRGPNDGDNRARAASIEVGAGEPARTEVREEQPAEAPLPTLVVLRASGPIEIDGNLSDAPWQAARGTQALVNTLTGEPAEFRSTAKILWDDTNLYVAFDVADDFLKSTYRNRDEHLWEQDAVEIMIDPGGRGENYFEVQVSPTGVLFDTRYDRRRDPAPIGHADWSPAIRAAATRRGTPNDATPDEGYTVEVAIPWAAFNTGTPAYERPQPGATWRLNFYVMDARQEGQRSAGWSPTRINDFHVPPRFGRIAFVDPSAAVAPPPNAPGGAEAPANPTVPLQLPPSLINKLRQGAPGGAGSIEQQRERQRPRPGEELPTAPGMEQPAMEEPAPGMQ